MGPSHLNTIILDSGSSKCLCQPPLECTAHHSGSGHYVCHNGPVELLWRPSRLPHGSAWKSLFNAFVHLHSVRPQDGNGSWHPTTTDEHSTPLSLVPSSRTWVSEGVSLMDSPPLDPMHSGVHFSPRMNHSVFYSSSQPQVNKTVPLYTNLTMLKVLLFLLVSYLLLQLWRIT